MKIPSPPAERLIQLACICLLAGRGWQHLRGDLPMHVWEALGGDGSLVLWLVPVIGIFYGLLALGTFWSPKPTTWVITAYSMSSGLLLGLSWISFQVSGYQLAQLLEHSIQVGSPLLWLWLLHTGRFQRQHVFPTLLIIAITFVAHGSYAIGLYPVPGHFLHMSTQILGLTGTEAQQFLFAMGVLDFLVAMGIFLPKLARMSLLYACLWGGLTAIARTWVGLIEEPISLSTLAAYLPHTLYRLPHGLLPLAVWAALRKT